jgi:hypothetical protein
MKALLIQMPAVVELSSRSPSRTPLNNSQSNQDILKMSALVTVIGPPSISMPLRKIKASISTSKNGPSR